MELTAKSVAPVLLNASVMTQCAAVRTTRGVIKAPEHRDSLVSTKTAKGN